MLISDVKHLYLYPQIHLTIRWLDGTQTRTLHWTTSAAELVNILQLQVCWRTAATKQGPQNVIATVVPVPSTHQCRLVCTQIGAKCNGSDKSRGGRVTIADSCLLESSKTGRCCCCVGVLSACWCRLMCDRSRDCLQKYRNGNYTAILLGESLPIWLIFLTLWLPSRKWVVNRAIV